MADYLTITDFRILMNLKGELYLIETLMGLSKLFSVLVHNLYYITRSNSNSCRFSGTLRVEMSSFNPLNGTFIADHITRETPFIPQQICQQAFVRTGRNSIDAVFDIQVGNG